MVLPPNCSVICFQVFLDHRPKEEVTKLVTAKTNGATPLVLSCRNGHHEVVQYLVDRYFLPALYLVTIAFQTSQYM